MNKQYYTGLFALLFLLSGVSSVFSAEIPSYMKDNLSSPKSNICPIICNIMYPEGVVKGSDGAQNLEEAQQKLKRKLVAKLYAEGLTTRTNMQKKAEEDKKKALEGAISSPMKDKKEVLDSMQPYLISIVNHLSSIAALEASIAALEGTLAITNDPGKASVCFLEKRCHCADLINGLSVKDICPEMEDEHE